MPQHNDDYEEEECEESVKYYQEAKEVLSVPQDGLEMAGAGIRVRHRPTGHVQTDLDFSSVKTRF